MSERPAGSSAQNPIKEEKSTSKKLVPYMPKLLKASDLIRKRHSFQRRKALVGLGRPASSQRTPKKGPLKLRDVSCNLMKEIAEDQKSCRAD